MEKGSAILWKYREGGDCAVEGGVIDLSNWAKLPIESGKYEHFELFVDCHGWYAWIVGENCYKEDLDGYTMALADKYKEIQ